MSTPTNVNRLAGTATITVGGVSYLLQGELTWGVAAVERETLVGMDAVHGYKEVPKPAFISATLRDTNNLTLASFNAMTSVNISVALANGKTLIGSNMWIVNAQEVKSAEATFEVRFEGVQGSVLEN